MLLVPENCEPYCAEYTENPLDWAYPGVGRAVIFMAAQGLVFFLILFIMESNWAQSCSQKMSMAQTSTDTGNDDAEVVVIGHPEHALVAEDDDVTAERKRITGTPTADLVQSDQLILKELKKYYGSLLAVDGLSVGIPRGECFGLLGINGAGKTSTFKMLIGDELVSSGEALIDGYSVTENVREVRHKTCLAL